VERQLLAAIKRFLAELKRRRVIPVTIAYLLIGGAVIQAADIVIPALLLPEWTVRLCVILVILGFPLVITLSWFFNITPHGIERDVSQKSIEAAESKPAKLIEHLPSTDNATASVAVLPFDNLSTEPGQDPLADGLATEIHATLGRIHQVRVSARRSAFRFRDSSQSIEDIAGELGVRYLLSGSLMRSGNQLRVIAELDDAQSGAQLWSQKFERELDDLFAIQSEIAEAVVGAFGIERERAEIAQARKMPTDDLDAWSLVQKSRNYIHDYSETSLDEARALLERSIEIDPAYGVAHAVLGSVLIERVLSGFSDDKQADRELALQAVKTARRLTPDDPYALKMGGMALAVCGQIEQSLEALRLCVEKAPFDFGAWGYFGWPLGARATPEDLDELHAIIDRLLRLAPTHPGAPYWLYHKSVASFLQGDLETAITQLRQAAARHRPVPWAYLHLASIRGALGRKAEALDAAEEAAKLNPAMTPEHYAECITVMTRADEAASRRLDGLVAAGLLKSGPVT